MRFARILTSIVFIAIFGIIPQVRQVLADSSPLDQLSRSKLALKDAATEGINVPVTGFHVHWKDGLHLYSKRENVKIKIGGSVIADGGHIDPDDELKRGFPDLEGGDANFRKLSVDMKGTLFKALEFRFDIDFANVRDIKDIWFRFQNIRFVDHIKFGHLKEPISLEALTSIKNSTFMEPSLPTRALTPGRNLGIRYGDDLLEKRMTLSTGAFWGTGSFSSVGEATDRLSESIGFNLTGRVTGLPWYEDNGSKFIHLGLSYSHRFRNNDFDSPIRIRSRPESRITDQRLVDTGKLPSDEGDGIGFEFASVLGSLSFQGEYLIALEKGMDDINFWGYYLYGSYFLTGERRIYKRTAGTFSGVSTFNPFDPEKGNWGAWEIGLRYSFLDLNDKDIGGGKERNITLGLNWYFTPKIRFMLNYIRATIKDRDKPFVQDAKADIFQIRFQFTI
jgi:phosphate-selective porin OprO/OprP